jgi:hypothetical protein
MTGSRTPWIALGVAVLSVAGSVARGQARPTDVPPGGYGSLTQDDLSLRLRTNDIDIRFVPLDPRVTRLLGKDSWESLRSVALSRRAAIDSVSNASGISRPGLALVTFFALQANARFDPQSVSVRVRSREFRPLAIVPFSGRFTSQQLDVREQVSAVYLFEEELPVNDSFVVLYAGQASDDWNNKQRMLERERGRVALRAQTSSRDTVTPAPRPTDSIAPDTATPDTGH